MTTSLLEMIDARIAECITSQEMFRGEMEDGTITPKAYMEFYGRIGLRIDELEQIRQKVVEIAKELEAQAQAGKTFPQEKFLTLEYVRELIGQPKQE